MIFKKSTLDFFRKRYNLIYPSLFLNIFEESAFKLNKKCSKLVHECGLFLQENYIVTVPSHFCLTGPDDIELESSFCIYGSLEGKNVCFGICPSMCKRRGYLFFLTPAGGLIEYLSRQILINISKWN
ncbi:MAG: hypothetical protein NZT61_04245 [Deltaproteobacteria bacterium]|nr:hypothetical protein [Deltaproteobacteria bacterium]MCX7952467.1 hypothetical protein [Deltaproteobacteria bacterium]